MPNPTLREPMLQRIWRHLTPHALAVLFVLVAFGATVSLQAVASRAYFILFVPAVMFAAWIGGLAAGVTASVATVFLAVSFLLPAGNLVDQFTWVVVAALVSIVTSTLVARRRAAEARLAALLADEQARRGHAESQSEQKTALLAEVAHELRQPLGAMTMAARLLQSADASSAAKDRAAGVIVRQTDHLRRLIDDLFDLSRMTRGELEVRKADVDLREIVEDCAHSIEPEATARGIRFVSSPPVSPVLIHADGTRVRQIVLNLLNNAVKFTERGGAVHLVVEQRTSEVVIRVRDTGRGIAAERLPAIFEMFQRGGEGSGLGVGLAVVKALTELHGGTVQARSEGVGHGSEFAVTLPARLRAIA